MTPKQARFVEEYLIDLNGTQAAMRAGYSVRTANEQAVRLLANVSVREAITAAQAKRAEAAAIDAQWVLDRLVTVAERCLQHEPVLDRRGKPLKVDTPDGQEACAYVFDAKGANGALGLIARHLGMLKDKLEVTTTVEQAEALRAARERAKRDA